MDGVEDVEIDGKPYVPPAPEQPEVQRWEVEIGCYRGQFEGHIDSYASSSVPVARAKLAFDDQGRVWMADTHAQYLARCLRDYARNWDAISEPSRETLKLAAHRLAGPEK